MGLFCKFIHEVPLLPHFMTNVSRGVSNWPLSIQGSGKHLSSMRTLSVIPAGNLNGPSVICLGSCIFLVKLRSHSWLSKVWEYIQPNFRNLLLIQLNFKFASTPSLIADAWLSKISLLGGFKSWFESLILASKVVGPINGTAIGLSRWRRTRHWNQTTTRNGQIPGLTGPFGIPYTYKTSEGTTTISSASLLRTRTSNWHGEETEFLHSCIILIHFNNTWHRWSIL